MIKDIPVQQFLDELASGAPTPGGGSAAAIMGAMGAALVGMVCNLTVGKKNYEAVDTEMKDLLAQAEALRTRLTDLVRADVEAFDRVMAAYRLPRESDAQKEARAEAIQDALKAATDVPLACTRAAAEVVRLSQAVADRGNRNVVADAGVAVVAGHAALRAAALNVYVNTSAIVDKAFVGSRLEVLNSILAGMDELQDDIYRTVRAQIRP